jgi:hypothetical protein
MVKKSGGISGGQAGMLKQLQKMQQDMVDAQEALEHETVEVSVVAAQLLLLSQDTSACNRSPSILM